MAEPTGGIVAAPFERDDARQRYVANCPTCGALLAYVSYAWARLRGGAPPVFARGPHDCQEAIPQPCRVTGPEPCTCGHDVIVHLSALQNGRCSRCECPTFTPVG